MQSERYQKRFNEVFRNKYIENEDTNEIFETETANNNNELIITNNVPFKPVEAKQPIIQDQLNIFMELQEELKM